MKDYFDNIFYSLKGLNLTAKQELTGYSYHPKFNQYVQWFISKGSTIDINKYPHIAYTLLERYYKEKK